MRKHGLEGYLRAVAALTQVRGGSPAARRATVVERETKGGRFPQREDDDAPSPRLERSMVSRSLRALSL